MDWYNQPSKTFIPVFGQRNIQSCFLQVTIVPKRVQVSVAQAWNMTMKCGRSCLVDFDLLIYHENQHWSITTSHNANILLLVPLAGLVWQRQSNAWNARMCTRMCIATTWGTGCFWQDTQHVWTPVPAQQPQAGPQPGNLNISQRWDATWCKHSRKLVDPKEHDKEHCVDPSAFLPFFTGEVWHLYVDGACPSNRGLAGRIESRCAEVACHVGVFLKSGFGVPLFIHF